MKLDPIVSVDLTADAAYIRLTDRAVARTVILGDGVNVDLDALDVVVGVEMVTVDAAIPFARLTSEFHVPSDAEEALRSLLPSVQASIMWRSTDGAVGAPHVVRSLQAT